MVPDRLTPSPSPGEWEPVDGRLIRWRLVCRACRAVHVEVDTPLGFQELARIRSEFLDEHAECKGANDVG